LFGSSFARNKDEMAAEIQSDQLVQILVQIIGRFPFRRRMPAAKV
jgi:hypothetical protein